MKKSILYVLALFLFIPATKAQPRIEKSIAATEEARLESQADAIEKLANAQVRLISLKTELKLIDNENRKAARTVKYASLVAAATSVIIGVYAYKSANAAKSFQRAESMGYLTFYSTISGLVSTTTATGATLTEISLTTPQIKDLENQIDATMKEIRILKADFQKLK